MCITFFIAKYITFLPNSAWLFYKKRKYYIIILTKIAGVIVMGIKLKFVQDDTANDVEIIIRAKEQNEEVEKILKLLGKRNDNNIICNVLSNEQLVDIKDIIIISKDGRYLSVKTINGQYILNEPLYKIEEKLDKSWFVKISQSEIVNLKYVKKWSLCTGGIIKIELQNDIQSYTSRRYATLIKEILRKGGGKR